MRDSHAKQRPQQEDINRLRKLWDEGIASGTAGKIDFAALRLEARLRLEAAKALR
jgi:antitoxin ParD1/3/4